MIEHLIHTLQSSKIGLKVVNGSLKINAPKGTLTPEIIDEIKTHKNGLIALLSSSESIPRVEEKACYKLTSSQKRLWTLSQFDAGNTAYNIFNAFEFTGDVIIDNLSIAFRKLIERHESLRTIFKEDTNGILSQYIIPIAQCTEELRYVDLSDQSEAYIQDTYIHAFKEHRFDLQCGPLFIGEVIKVSDNTHILMFNMHHIIGDGWSMGILNKEFITLYNALALDQEIVLPELPIQYKEYAEWQNTKNRQEALKTSKSFWLDTFSGDLPILEVPSENPRPKVKTYNGSGVNYSFSKEFTSSLNEYAQQKGMTLFMILMASVNGLLSRYANTRDIILGTPIAGRQHSDLENQVGLYLNTLAIRTAFEKETTFEELLAIQKETLLNAYSHQEYPFDSLVEDLKLQRDLSRSALFDVLVVFQNQRELLVSDTIKVHGVEAVPYKNLEKSFSKFDISFAFLESENQLLLHIEFNTDIYTVAFIERLGVHLENFLAKAIQAPAQKVADINFLTKSEESQILHDFNNTTASLPETTVVDLFVAQALKTPDATAIVFGDKNISYKELDATSNELAHYLIASYDLNKEDLVGVKLERSEWLLISLLAILKTGAAYVPIDPTYPDERIAYIQEDSKCKVTICEELVTAFLDTESISKELPKASYQSESLAYVIYTSGSTGKPKGVMIEHRSLVNLCLWHVDTFEVQRESRGTLFAGIGFDASVWEIYPYLISGASLYPIASQNIRMNVSLLKAFLVENEITHSYLPTKICQTLVHEDIQLKGMKILTGGEALQLPQKEIDLTIYNNYGPTENTVVTTYHIVENNPATVIPIGKPVYNTQVYIVSDRMSLQPVGVIGELCISGDGLSRGYLNQPTLTAEKFVVNRFRESGLLYKTGDLCKWLPDGTIEFVGRKDDQIKIRGHRIELGEIQQVIQCQEHIEENVVIVDTSSGEPSIACYYVSNEPINTSDLRMELSNQLPNYMLPSYYIEIAHIPLTANGKLDKKSLPEVNASYLVKTKYVAPESALEEELVTLWEEILEMKKIGVTDNFFELGGHSLKATKLLSLIHQKYNAKIDVEKIFANPTIKFLAVEIENSTWLRGLQTTSTVNRLVI
ncbi:amino acid adenylation domain-containing protein [uncultured Dokdonia sp.]|uniref:non-ribosomal peptide synthetase n=1 Tax=uncultured Dokdonia sp. TaxID=575653 RepID=UPI00262F065C|nr:amino acid adenylation domain-containing protein [uncultured Dokdonia sp.]